MDDLKATLEYDMTSYLSEPRWMDGLQHFLGVGYETGLSIVIDLRCVVMPIEQRSATLSGFMEYVTRLSIVTYVKCVVTSMHRGLQHFLGVWNV